MKTANQWRETWLEILYLFIGEALVSAIVVGIFAIININELLPSILGSLLGTFVVLLNYFILSFAVNRAIDEYMRKRGEKEMNEEEAEEFAKANSSSITLAAKGTYLLRMLLMVGVLVGAFLLQGVFNVIATVVPLLTYRLVLYGIEFIKAKFGKKKEV